MCGRYVLKREDLEALVKELGLPSLEEFHSRYNIAPTSVVPVIRVGQTGGLAITGLRWGLVPAWTKPGAPVKPLVNVRAETLTARFHGAMRSRRCILPASGFFEWQSVGSRKQPWFFAPSDGTPFGLAGIWDLWRGDGSVELETCAIVTTTPSEVMRPIHHRMPVLLTPAQCRTWLAESVEAIEWLPAPVSAQVVTALKVGPAVSSVRNDGPECIAAAADGPVADAGPPLSFGW